mmetsp:Transcript_2085/g.4528  ORF Transcript_2085/g.4528 Transcript_2085/m.4528 type:complete len:241 (+) Transcript_2085:121-843(+)
MARNRRRRRQNQQKNRPPPPSPHYTAYHFDQMFTSFAEAEAGLHYRFNAEPPNTFILKITGQTICLPKYNGILWWFPAIREDQPALEYAISFFFHIVESVQTLSLLVWPIELLSQVGIIQTLLGVLLTVPLGTYLEDTFGQNKGTAYASLQTIYLTFHLKNYYFLKWAQQIHSRTAVAFYFLAAAFVIGNLLSRLETKVGRTSFAILVTYPQLILWLDMVPSIVGQVGIVTFLVTMILWF